MRCLILVSLATLIAGCGFCIGDDDRDDDKNVVHSYICVVTDREAKYTVYHEFDPSFRPRKCVSPPQDLTREPQVCIGLPAGSYRIEFDPIPGYLVPNPIFPINLMIGEKKPITVSIAPLVPK